MSTEVPGFITKLPRVLQPSCRFLAQTRLGILFLVLAVLWVLQTLGVLVFDSFSGLIGLGFWIYVLGFTIRGLLALRPKLLWRIRRKLIISYLLIGLVPTVLVLSFFLLSAYLIFAQLSSYIVMASLDRTSIEAAHVADLAVAEILRVQSEKTLPLQDSEITRVVRKRLDSLAPSYPRISAAYFDAGGRHVVVGTSAFDRVNAPFPEWARRESYRGLLRVHDEYVLGAVSEPLTSREVHVVVTMPLATALESVERATGIKVEERGGAVARSSGEGISITLPPRDDPSAGRTRLSTAAQAASWTWIALLQARRWETGETEEEHQAVYVRFSWLSVYDLIGTSTTQVQLGGALLMALGILAALFLAIEVVAIFVGLLLARSITGSIHTLSMGTERIRNGDFEYKIQVKSKDQLGELAESFNLMTTSVRELLRQSAEKERLEEELRIARRIQMSLLPKEEVNLPGLTVAALCLPAAEVGGDYYDFLPLSNHRLALLIADVSGKGTSAALYMAELKGLVLALSKMYDSPRKLLIEANQILGKHLDSKSFITMAYAVVDMAERKMTYARAGHNPIMQLCANGGGTRLLAPDGLGLALDRTGRFDELLAEDSVTLHSGDVFLFFTDGLSEAMNPQLDLFGESRLREILESNRDLSAEDMREKIIEEVSLFAEGERQHDDMTMVLVKVT